MIVTVSTVKDSLENVQQFVRGNLASGVDHMFLFLDAGDAAVEEWLSTQPHVTFVVTDKSWWQGERPQLLNRRQCINANLARSLVSLTDWAEWIFHIDADEVARIDRAAVAEVGPHRPVVGLAPLEVVSELEPAGRPTRFKRLLEDDELQLLVTLGLLEEPTNSLYFRSHIAGKVGVRPCLDLWLKFHSAVDQDGTRLQAVRGDDLTLLHYESFSGAEFVRKWTNMVTSGPSMHFGSHRMKIATALKVIVTSDLPSGVKEKYLTEIYRTHMEDAVETLSDLRLLVETDPLRGGHVPQRLDDAEHALLKARLEGLRDVSKKQFLPTPGGAQTVARTLAGIAPEARPRLHADTGWTPPSQGRVPRALRDRVRRRAGR